MGGRLRERVAVRVVNPDGRVDALDDEAVADAQRLIRRLEAEGVTAVTSARIEVIETLEAREALVACGNAVASWIRIGGWRLIVHRVGVLILIIILRHLLIEGIAGKGGRPGDKHTGASFGEVL